ncbi:hypothetical protein [Autumnicola psychrophila]|uniref:Uncharacterized protein n=1 Tax=Autumnicola psychrophila TaxID=3075592 RepID=A0ABU3DUC3_9FLAO|nr:hypothetical protein [Zunongwangia sp. F225]MDT0687321.1 hypothetical protein [Zunongwangia sp. F225]
MLYKPTTGFLYLPQSPKPIFKGANEIHFDYYFSARYFEENIILDVTTKIFSEYDHVFTRISSHCIKRGEVKTCVKECLLTHFLRMGVSRKRANFLLKNFSLSFRKLEVQKELREV